MRSGGVLLRTRVPGNRLAEATLEVEVDRIRSSAEPFPSPGRRGVFEAGAVRIEAADGEVLASRSDPRPLFFGRPGLRRNLRWDELDAIYFAGYAWWNYINVPYLFMRAGVETVEGAPLSLGAERWRRLDVTFPPGLDTHSAKQTFLYDADLRLRRHDYTAEIVSRWARAAHLCSAHREVEGLLLPTARRVVPVGPGGRVMPGPTLVRLELSEIEVVWR